MFQGTIGKGRNVPFGPYSESVSITSFAVDPTSLAGTIRPGLTFAGLVRLIGGLGVAVLGLLPFIDPQVPFDPYALVLSCGLGGLLVFLQAFLWSRRCHIAVDGGMLRLRQIHALFAPLVMDVPLAEYRGVCLDRFGTGRHTIWSVALVHDDWAKVVPLAWGRSYREIAAGVGSYATALDMPALEMADEITAYPGDAFNLPLADKVARGLVAATNPGAPPAGLAVEWQSGRGIIQFTPNDRLELEGGNVTFQRRRFGRWSSRWHVSLADVLSVQIGRWRGFRKQSPAVVLRTADGMLFAGPCPDDPAARWLRARLMADVVG